MDEDEGTDTDEEEDYESSSKESKATCSVVLQQFQVAKEENNGEMEHIADMQR